MDLTEFLLARIAEDEAVATRPCGEAHPEADVYCYPPEHPDPKGMAECEAKRRIVESRAAISLPSKEIHDEVQHQREYVWKLLALPYADHPDYDPEWKV